MAAQSELVFALSPPGGAVASPLERFVARVQVAVPGTDEVERDVDLLPDGTASLIVRVTGSGSADAGVRGPATLAYYKRTRVMPLVVRVIFRPGGAYPFFGLPIDALADRIVPLEDLWGADAAPLLEDVLEGAARRQNVVACVERALIARMRQHPFEPASAIAARAAIPLLARGTHSLDEVAARLGVSARNLRRAFTSTVGVGPKTYARHARFQRALALGH